MSAPNPSVLITCIASGIVETCELRAAGEQFGEGVKTCRRVLRTSKGCVSIAETVPERAPEMKEVVRGERSGRDSVNWVLRISNPAQYRPGNQLLDRVEKR
jgi:hypothetical protein